MRLQGQWNRLLSLAAIGTVFWTSWPGTHGGPGLARAEEAAPTATTQEEYCRTWATNATIGAKVQGRDGPRKITYIDENELRYLLKHQVAGDNLYLLKGEYTPGEKRFLEESLLAGYDRSAQWYAGHGGQSPDLANWESETFDACMRELPNAIRDLLETR